MVTSPWLTRDNLERNPPDSLNFRVTRLGALPNVETVKQRIDSALGRATLGATVMAVALTVMSGPVAADEPADPTPTTASAETGEVDGAIVAVDAPPVPSVPGTGEVDGAIVAVDAPPVPSTVASPLARSAGAVAQRTMLGRLRATIIEQQIATAVADATAGVALELRVGH